MSPVPTLSDVAKLAGVSLATVDRVINRRPNVRAHTVERVRAAMAALDYRVDPLAAGLARRKRYKFVFLLPGGTNAFMADLAARLESLTGWLTANRASVETVFADVFDPKRLVEAIDGIDREADGAAIVALDHPDILAAIDRLSGDGVAVVTLVSDVPKSQRLRFIGIDNTAAGRSAGTLLGRFTAGRAGTVALLVGSLSLRDHVDRCLGFSQIVERNFPHLTVLPVIETRDERNRAERAAKDVLGEHPDLVGIYNVGAGNVGIASALRAGATAIRPVVVCHELTPGSVEALRAGQFDAILAQNPGHEVRSAARVLLACASKTGVVEEQERIRIDIFIRENLPA
ncbi:LacI family DNA-binding transcriptional regulator [Fulvimarina sp. 2208YS6-2-32]|uniref:LacI family DNA-binding transcriptional regulator n=1 Tax=Fulvimarina uroteuthidis TaxID=3098149 RepID=A0ABU5I2S3_9HYPH|nr:LacI family DNA-binding transcriptional regulator [Fulvimarina sp. 2208YS6-2-32]MDY8109526.1 LacI family DNA-binding transcriptional regulator [Fulvimarina sp. 2208YS6-2-32]